MKNTIGQLTEIIYKWVKRDKKMIAASLAVGLAVALSQAVIAAVNYSDRIHDGIAEQVIRLHVLANSDDPKDQGLKLMVRDAVIKRLESSLENAGSIEEAREVISKNLEMVEEAAREVITQNGYHYPVTAELAASDFPTKEYGSYSLPAGEYQAIRVVIGEGGGKNWWCVMFPPMCLADAGVVPGGEKDVFGQGLKKALTQEEYALVSEKNARPEWKVKFKTVEIWQEIKTKLFK